MELLDGKQILVHLHTYVCVGREVKSDADISAFKIEYLWHEILRQNKYFIATYFHFLYEQILKKRQMKYFVCKRM